MDELSGKRVLVLGLGLSGRSAATFCAESGARVVAADERAVEAAGLDPRIELRTGAAFPDPRDFDLVVPSPGVPRERYAAGARQVWGDLELAFRALSIPVVAVTGTNGKSTTVRLIEAMLKAAGLRARAAGNVGEPALGLVGEALDVAVLEVSSFQLEAVDAFRPRVAVLLNVSEDHLDRHGSLEDYAAAKGRLFARQQPGDTAIVNGDDPIALRLGAGSRGALEIFRRGTPVERGAWWEAGAITLSGPEGVRRLELGPDTLPHGSVRENLPAALLAARAAGADPARAIDALLAFAPLPHRLETIGRFGEVTWIDDSKATNPGAAERSLASQSAPVIWIAGGRDKGLHFEPLAETVASHVRHALLIGETAEKIAASLPAGVAAEITGTLDAAVARAAALARPGDVVLLAPGCASFDQFASFEERGQRFRAAVTHVARNSGAEASR